MIDQTRTSIESQMLKSISNFKDEISKLRTGRANPAMVENITVDYYGTPTPLNQMANISAPEARMLLVQPWDVSALEVIEKAISQSQLGVTPQNDGKLIRLPMPPLTEETRKEVVKQASKMGEDARVTIRNIRRGGIDELKKAEKNKEITEDDLKKGQDQIQKLTDQFVKEVEKLLEDKSQDIMKV